MRKSAVSNSKLVSQMKASKKYYIDCTQYNTHDFAILSRKGDIMQVAFIDLVKYIPDTLATEWDSDIVSRGMTIEKMFGKYGKYAKPQGSIQFSLDAVGYVSKTWFTVLGYTKPEDLTLEDVYVYAVEINQAVIMEEPFPENVGEIVAHQEALPEL